MTHQLIILLLYSILIVSLSSSGISVPNQLPILKDLAAKDNVVAGSSVGHKYLQEDVKYKETLTSQFAVVTPENEMKWRTTEPSQGNFNYTEGNYIVKYANANDMMVRGHNLCWGKSNPDWLQNGTFTAGEMEEILRNHITHVVSHFKNANLIAWDVVNEAVADEPNGSFPNTLKQYQIIDPDTLLFYNDYGGELIGKKSDAIYEMIKVLKEKGVPIDGVGLQMHLSLSFWLKEPLFKYKLLANLIRLTELGLVVHITEMDVKLDVERMSKDEQEKLQSQVYSQVIDACIHSQCKAFIVWGFTDKYSWLGEQYLPCLFSSEYTPKPSFYGAADSFNNSTTGTLGES